MNNLNGYSRLLILMILVFAFCYSLYYIPTKVGSYPLKKIDLLSDLRIKDTNIITDSAFLVSAEDTFLDADTLNVIEEPVYTEQQLRMRDSLYKDFQTVVSKEQKRNFIEDFSQGRVSLSRFFTSIEKIDSIGRPVRIGFFGDSFIEGDMIVGHFREYLQSEFGGRGVGFVPVVSIVGDFRKTFTQRQNGWKLASVMKKSSSDFNQTGQYFFAEDGETNLRVNSTEYYKNTYPYSSVKLYYDKSHESCVCFTTSKGDTLNSVISPTSYLSCKEWRGEFEDFSINFSNSDSLRLIGLAMESDNGIIVDNHSIRGNNGLFFNSIDSLKFREFATEREYDLIILQYGINVMQDTIVNYGWYTRNMTKVINNFKTNYPHADILVLGVPDRAYNHNGVYKTMPAVEAITKAQRNMARKCEVSFLSVYELMGGEDSMVKYVENGWASKDYTHMSFGGGRDIARKLFKVITLEKEFYDKAKAIN